MGSLSKQHAADVYVRNGADSDKGTAAASLRSIQDDSGEMSCLTPKRSMSIARRGRRGRGECRCFQ